MPTILPETTWYEEAHHGNAHNPAQLPGMKKPIMAMPTIMVPGNFLSSSSVTSKCYKKPQETHF